MKSINLTIAVFSVLFIITSCSTDKKVQLNKLKQQQSALDEKIKYLEDELIAEQKNFINTKEFKFVGLTDVKPGKFDHFIRVQGKLDGDQNVGVYAEVPGTVSAKYADVGHRVVKGQVLAQIDDQQYRSQLEGLETQYKFSAEMFDKQKRLWDQKIGSEVQYLHGEVVRAGEQCNVPTPVNKVLTETLMALTNREIPLEEFAHRPEKLLEKIPV